MNFIPRLKHCAFMLTAVSLTCVDANASPLDSLYVAPAAYYASPDSRLAADHDFGAQISVGAYLSRQWQAELVSEASKFKRDDGADTYKQIGASVQAIFSPFEDLTVRPLFLGGMGWLHTSSSNSGDSNRPLIRAGAGLQWQLPNSPWGVRGTAVWRHEFNNGIVSPSADLNTYVYSLGVSYQFGGTRSASQAESGSLSTPTATPNIVTPTVVAAPAKPTVTPTRERSLAPAAPDQDGDGIADEQDKCPDTPASAIVDADGCPIRLK